MPRQLCDKSLILTTHLDDSEKDVNSVISNDKTLEMRSQLNSSKCDKNNYVYLTSNISIKSKLLKLLWNFQINLCFLNNILRMQVDQFDNDDGVNQG